jgi:hypothetical protein
MEKSAFGKRRLRWLSGVSVATLLYSALPFAVASAAIFSTTIIDNINTFSSGNLVLSATTGAAMCNSASGSVSVDSAICSGNPLPLGPLSTTASSATITLSAVGSVGATTGHISSSGCGVQQAADATGADPALAYGGLTYQSSGPLSGTSVAFNGTTGNFQTINSYSGPTVFTQVAWFKTTTSGSIMGFANTYGVTGLGSWDRMIWVDPTGHVVAGVYPGATDEITSTSAYNNGAWHFVAVTLSTTGFDLYVDGALQASSTSVTTAQVYTGYWHLGWSNAISGWPDSPTSAFFSGSLAGVGIIPTALTSTQVSSLYASATFSAYSTSVNARSPSAYWSLNDTGATPYLGAVPGLSGSSSTLVDASGNANTGSIEGTVTLGSSGPTSLGGNAISLPGTSGSLVNTTTQYTDPDSGNGVLSQSIWFKTTTSGALMGFTSQQTDSPTPSSYDRMFWIDATGHLVYAIYSPDVSGSFSEVTSPSTYNNGAWHLAVVTVGSAGEILYVDGVQVASAAAAQNAQSYSGYWHLGYAYTGSWANAPSSNYFAGSLADAAIFPSALTGTQVASLYSATSAANESSVVLGLSPTSYWPLTDTNLSSACALAQITVQYTRGTTTSCLAPTAAGACPAPSSSVLASTFSVGTLLGATLTSPETITTSMSVASGLPASATNLRIIDPFTFYESVSAFNAQLSYPSGAVIL